MKRDKTITIARAVRNYPGGIAEVTLVWRCFYSKLGVEYRQVTDWGDLSYDISDKGVRYLLWTFIRGQGHLNKDSYYITVPPSPLWWNFINMVRAS